MQENKLATYFRDQWSIDMNTNSSIDEIREKLSKHIHYLINHDFGGLINLLYTVDINESKLRSLLKTNTDLDAGNLIATLIIERQIQKIKTREDLKTGDDDSDEERW